MHSPWLKDFALSKSAYLGLFLLAVSLVTLWWLLPGYFRPGNLASEMRTTLPILCIALGQMVVIAGRGIDLSLGPLLTLSAATMVAVFGPGTGGAIDAVAIAAGLGVALAGGALNGLLVSAFRLQPIVATFATSFIYSGLALYVLPQPGGIVPTWLTDVVRTWILAPFPVLFVVALGLVWLALIRTKAYRLLLATGGEPSAAQTTGINTRAVQFWTYVAAGGLTGLGALLLSGDIGTGDPLVGNSLTLSSIVAVVIGGTALTGGSATYVGTVAGVALLVILRNIVFAAGLPFDWQPLVDGSLVVAVLSIAALLTRWKRNVA